MATSDIDRLLEQAASGEAAGDSSIDAMLMQVAAEPPERLDDAVFGRPEAWHTSDLETTVVDTSHPLWNRVYDELQTRRYVQEHLPSKGWLMETEAALMNGGALFLTANSAGAASSLAKGVAHTLRYFGAEDAAKWAQGYSDVVADFGKSQQALRGAISTVASERRAAEVASGTTSGTVSEVRRHYEGFATSLVSMIESLGIGKALGAPSVAPAEGAGFALRGGTAFVNQLPLAVAFGADQYGQAFHDAKNAGLDDSAANYYALRQGAVEGGIQSVFSLLGLGGLESTVTGTTRHALRRSFGKFLLDAGVSYAQEIPEELMTNILEATDQAITLDRKSGLSKDELATLTIDTFIQVGMLLGVAETTAYGLERVNPARAEALFKQRAELTDDLAAQTLDTPAKQKQALELILAMEANVRARAAEGQQALEERTREEAAAAVANAIANADTLPTPNVDALVNAARGERIVPVEPGVRTPPTPSKPKISVEAKAVEETTPDEPTPTEETPEEEDEAASDEPADFAVDQTLDATKKKAAAEALVAAQPWVDRVIARVPKRPGVDLQQAAQEFLSGKYSKGSKKRPELKGQYRLLDALEGEAAGLTNAQGRPLTVRARLEFALQRWLAKGGRGGTERAPGRKLDEAGTRAADTSKPKKAPASMDAETPTGKKNPAVASMAAKGLTPVEELEAAETEVDTEAFQKELAVELKNVPLARQQEHAKKKILALAEDHPLRVALEGQLRRQAPPGMGGGRLDIDVVSLANAIASGKPRDKVDLWVVAHGQGTRVTPTTLEHHRAVAFMQSLGIELRLYTKMNRGGVYLSRTRLESWGEAHKRPIVVLDKGFTGSELAGAVVHESVHYLATEHKDLYERLRKAVPPEVRSAASKDYYSRLSASDRILYDAYYEEEGVATAMQLPAQHKAFWNAVYASAPAKIIRKLAEAIRQWYHQVLDSASRLGLLPETFRELSDHLGAVYGEIMRDVRDRQQMKTMTEVFNAANDVGRALGAVAPEMGRRAEPAPTWTAEEEASLGVEDARDLVDTLQNDIAANPGIAAEIQPELQAAQQQLVETEARLSTLRPSAALTREWAVSKLQVVHEVRGNGTLTGVHKRIAGDDWVRVMYGPNSYKWEQVQDLQTAESVAPGMGRRAVPPLTTEQAALFEREDVKGLMAELAAVRNDKAQAAKAAELRAKLDALGATKEVRYSFHRHGGKGAVPARPTKWTPERIAKTAAYAERLASLRALVVSFADLEHGEVADNVVKAAVGKNGKIGYASMVALTRELTVLRQQLVKQTAGVRGAGAAVTRERAAALKRAKATYKGFDNAGSSTSMEHVVARWGTQHDLPWQYVYTASVGAMGHAMQAKKKVLETLQEMIGSKSLRKLRKALNNTALEKAVRDALIDPQKVTTLTKEQLIAYNAVDKHRVAQELDVRVARVLHAYREDKLPQTLKAKNETDIHGAGVKETDLVADLVRCREIIEREASQEDVLAALEKFLADKTWGVEADYAPRAALLYDRTYYDTEGNPSKLSARSAQARTSHGEPEYQSGTLWDRLQRNAVDIARMKYMEMPLAAVDVMRKIMRRNITAELTAGRMTQEKFEDTMATLDTQMKTWMRSLTGHGPQENPGAKLLLRAMSTGLTIHFATQMGAIQNTVQMLVNTDLTAFAQIAAEFPNAEAALHFALFVDESPVLGAEAALRDVSVTSIPGVTQAFGFLKWLGKSFERMDFISRKSAFIARWKKVSKAFRKLKASDVSVGALTSARASAGLTELTDAQWAHAQEIWTARGVGALANYAAEQHVATTFYEYMPHKRSFVEQGKLGRVVASLYTFPRCLTQRMLVDVRKVGQALAGRLPLSEGSRAAARIAFVYVMTNVTWQAVRLFIHGSTEEDKDKDIERSVWEQALHPRGMWNSAAYAPGGYALNLLNQFKEFIDAVGEGVSGEEGADRKIARASTRLAKTFVPFYRHVFAAINIGLDRSMRAGSADRELITRLQNIKGILNKTYEYEQSPAQARTHLEAFQAFMYGTDTGLVHATATATDYGPAPDTDAKSISDYGNRAKRLLHAALLQGNQFASEHDKERARVEAQRMRNYFERRGMAVGHTELSLMIFQGDAADRLDFEKSLRVAGMPSQNAAGYYLDELYKTLKESKK